MIGQFFDDKQVNAVTVFAKDIFYYVFQKIGIVLEFNLESTGYPESNAGVVCRKLQYIQEKGFPGSREAEPKRKYRQAICLYIPLFSRQRKKLEKIMDDYN